MCYLALYRTHLIQMMNFPGIAKLLDIKIPRLKVGAPTSVLIRPAVRLHCIFVYVDMDISKMFHDFSGWERQTSNYCLHAKNLL